MVCKHTIYECFSMCGFHVAVVYGLENNSWLSGRKYALGTQNTFAQQIRGYATTRGFLEITSAAVRANAPLQCRE